MVNKCIKKYNSFFYPRAHFNIYLALPFFRNMIMFKLRFLVVSFILASFITCKENVQDRRNNKPKEKGNNSCLTQTDKEEIIYAILNTKDIQDHLHPEIAGQLPIKVLMNKFIPRDLSVESNGYKVKFVDSVNLTENTFRIHIQKIDCVKKSLNFGVTYPIEGQIYFGGELVFDGNDWNANISSVGIAD